MNPLYFFTYLIFFAISFTGIHLTYPFNLLPLGFVFIFIPLLDYLIGLNTRVAKIEEEKSWKRLKVWAPAIYLYFITHFYLLISALIKANSYNTLDLVICSIGLGLYNGGLGITVAHELCHKKENKHKLMADILLSSVSYQHFAVEHVRGHHINVATIEDPASARLNENVYHFLIRTISGSFKSAFKIDSRSVLRGIVMTLNFAALSYFLASWNGLILFVIQSIVAVTLLELVNYVEHYGLSRKKLDNGRYERVIPIHSWNSAHHFSNSILFNLQRHSDHHASAHLPYTVLKHQDSAPQLPSGYPGMIMLSLVPPLWFKVMHKELKKIKAI